MPTDFGRYEAHQVYYMANWDNEAKKIRLDPVTIDENDNKAWHDEDDHINAIKLEIPIEDTNFIEKLKEPDETVGSALEELKTKLEQLKNSMCNYGAKIDTETLAKCVLPDETFTKLQEEAVKQARQQVERQAIQYYKNKLKEETKMAKCIFKVGDKVEAINNRYCSTTKANEWKGKIIDIYQEEQNTYFDAITISSKDSSAVECRRTFYRLHPEDFKILGTESIVEDLDHYIINDGATILFWIDGTKTIVKRTKEDKFDKRVAFLTAYFQKNSGLSRTKANKFLANLKVEEPKEKIKKVKEKDKKVTKVSKAENPIEEVQLEELVEEVKKKGE